MKSKGVAYLLWFFLGALGGHCFYLGKVGKGILYLCTVGLFGIGLIYDLFTLGSQVDVYNASRNGAGNKNVNTNSNVQNIVINIPGKEEQNCNV